MKACEVGDWLQRIAGKRDHREVLSDNDFVLRPGPHIDLFYPVAAQTQNLAPERDPAGHDRSEIDDHAQ